MAHEKMLKIANYQRNVNQNHNEISPHICEKVSQSLSCVPLFAIPWTVVHQSPLSMGFSRQGFWIGLPHPPPGDLPDLGIKCTSPVSPALQTDSLPLSHWGSRLLLWLCLIPLAPFAKIVYLSIYSPHCFLTVLITSKSF